MDTTNEPSTQFDKLKVRLDYLAYILGIAFSRDKLLYLLLFGGVLSILLEFSAIGVLAVISQPEVPVAFIDLTTVDRESLFLIFVALLLVRFISLFIVESSFVYFAKELQVHLSTRAVEQITREDIKKIEEKEIGHYITLAGDEASLASQVLLSALNIINISFLSVVYVVLILLFSTNVMLATVGLFAVIALAIWPVYRRLFMLGYQQAIFRRRSHSLFMDSLNSLRVVRAFGLGPYVTHEYHDALADYCGVNSSIDIYGALVKYVPLVLLLVFYGMLLAYVFNADEGYDVALLITVLVMLVRLLHSIGTLSGYVGKVIGDLKGVSNIVTFLRKPRDDVGGAQLESAVDEIKISNVSFGYGSNRIFEGFNYTFRAGTSYAIYGESGTGKSTLLDLIMDYVSPETGQITMNGRQVQDLESNTLTDRVVYVSQDSLIFNRTIRENICLDREFTNAEIDQALADACLTEMVADLEEGLDFSLAYRGANVSGGQRQRINLARALIRKPDVLILDEVTSALDPQTKTDVVDRLLSAFKGKLLIFVTHDSSFFESVDEVIDLGKLKHGAAGQGELT